MEEIFLYRKSTIFIMLKTNNKSFSDSRKAPWCYLSPSFSPPVRRVNLPVVPSWPFFQASCRLIPCSTTESLCPHSGELFGCLDNACNGPESICPIYQACRCLLLPHPQLLHCCTMS